MGLHQTQIAKESIRREDWSGKKVLDIGCSNGILSLEIMNLTVAKELVGVDTGMDRITQAKQMAKEKKLSNVSFHLSKAENLSKIPDNSFDIIFCNMAFQQFKDKEAALLEMFRVLKDGGEAFINFNIEKSPTWYQQEVVYEKLFGDPEKVITRAKTYDSSKFEPAAKKAGFKEVNIKIADNIYYYQAFNEAVDKNDDNFFAREKGLTPEQNKELNTELEKYLESTREERGIPESWKIMFARLKK